MTKVTGNAESNKPGKMDKPLFANPSPATSTPFGLAPYEAEGKPLTTIAGTFVNPHAIPVTTEVYACMNSSGWPWSANTGALGTAS